MHPGYITKPSVTMVFPRLSSINACRGFMTLQQSMNLQPKRQRMGCFDGVLAGHISILHFDCYNHLSTRSSTNLASKELTITSEPEYLALVTQTADKMRQAVRDYIYEYSGSKHTIGINGVDGMMQCPLSDNVTWHPMPPPIKLVGILATNSISCNHSTSVDTHGNERYSEQISAICTADGILYEPWRVPPTKDAIERAIHHANERLDVHGILVFYPVFDKLLNEDSTLQHEGRRQSTRGPIKCSTTGVYYKSMDDYFRDLVLPQKDVEGYHRKALRVKSPECREDDDQLASCGSPSNGAQLVSSCSSPTPNSTVSADTVEGQYGPIYPCTALAVFRILESFLTQQNSTILSDADTDWIDKKCFAFANITMTIINRSEVLGLPLATMLSNQAATVYSVDKNSILQFQSDGKIRREHATVTLEQCVRNSSVIVSGVPSDDFTLPTEWISDNAIVINVANVSNFDEATLLTEKPGITYVPHVGRVTVAALESNLICLHRNYH